MRGLIKSDVETMVEEIIRGESKNVEFKEILPKNSEKYTKKPTEQLACPSK